MGDNYIRAQIERIWHDNPSFSFDEVADSLFKTISQEQLGRLMRNTSAVATFSNFRRALGRATFLLEPGVGVYSAPDLVFALFTDLCRICAMEDDLLKAKILESQDETDEDRAYIMVGYEPAPGWPPFKKSID